MSDLTNRKRFLVVSSLVLLLMSATATIGQVSDRSCLSLVKEQKCRSCFLFSKFEKPFAQNSDRGAQTGPQAAFTFVRSFRSNALKEQEKRLEPCILSFMSEDLLHRSTTDAKYGQENAQSKPQPAESDAGELAKKLANPISALISLPFQSNFDFGMGAGSGWRYTLNIQPVIPAALNANWNMISRTILPIIHQSNVVGNGSQSGLGDLNQSLFFSPNKTEPVIWGVGPALLVPTATDDALGTGKFSIGPTLLVLKQQNAWTYGALTNHLWSIAGGDSRAKVNSTFIQPFLSYNTRDAWTFSLNTESSYDWNGNHWSVPIHFSVSKLMKFGGHPISIGGAFRCWATSPAGGPRNCGLRLIATPLFPK